MLGGALIGLGLGSLISRGNSDNAVNQNENSSGSGASGTSGTSESTGGASGNYEDEQVLQEPEPKSNPLGALLLFGLLSTVVFYVVRRARRRSP
jgi:high-affinity Fe2+/Pb2+ permease